MGTRGLTSVISDGKHVVAQYGQWDHYPSGQGVTALAFLRDPEKVKNLRAAASKTRQIASEKHEALWADAGAIPGDAFVTMDVANRFDAAHPQLSRDMGAEILYYVANHHADEEIFLNLEPEFVEDTVFCEGVYEVDLDANTFTYYSPCYAKHTEPEPNPDARLTYPLDALPADAEFCVAADTLYGRNDPDED